MKASVVMVNWNGRHFLEKSLGSLKKQGYRDFELVFVDNGSTDGSAVYVKKIFPKSTIIRNPENLGFAEGNNIGIRAAKGDYIVALSNDTMADKDFLKELIKTAESDKKIGMVGSKMFFENKKINTFGHKALISGFSKDSKDSRIFSPCAGAALYKKEMLEDVRLGQDYFDSDFFCYYEDFDIGFRARLRGWKAVLSDAVVFHKHAGTAGVYTDFSIYYGNRNPLFVIIKNYPTSVLLLYSPLIFVTQMASLFKYALRGKFLLALKAKLDAIFAIKKFLKKRRVIQARRIISNRELKKLMTNELF